MLKIYIVEDDDNIRDLVLYALKAAGFDATGFDNPNDFWRELKKEMPALILLDIMLPGEDGISILKNLKSDSKTSQIPIIMLTAKSGEYDRVRGLDLGADDYITKPFSVLELISRIKAVIRRSTSNDNTRELRIGNVVLNTTKHTVTVQEENVILTFKEFELLQYLIENKGIVLSRDKIMSRIWKTDFEVETRTVDMHIKTLRQKLGDNGNIIETIRGIGYKVVD